MTHLHSLIVTSPENSGDTYGKPADQDFESDPEGTYRCLSLTSEHLRLSEDLIEVVGVQYINMVDVVAELLVDPEGTQPGPKLSPGNLYSFRARVFTPSALAPGGSADGKTYASCGSIEVHLKVGTWVPYQEVGFRIDSDNGVMGMIKIAEELEWNLNEMTVDQRRIHPQIPPYIYSEPRPSTVQLQCQHPMVRSDELLGVCSRMEVDTHSLERFRGLLLGDYNVHRSWKKKIVS